MGAPVAVNGTLHRIACRIGTSKPLYQHLVTGADTWLWVDTGIASTPDDYLFRYVDELPLTEPARQYALVTHADVDHFGGLSRLRTRFPALVGMAHQLDAPLIVDHDTLMSTRYLAHRDDGIVPPAWRQQELLSRAGETSRMEIRLSGGETLDLDNAGRWEVLHLPGHSDGHLGVWEPGSRRVILGDAVLGWGVEDIDGTVVAPPPYDDVERYSNTIDLLERMEIDVMYTSHFPLMKGGEVGAFLATCRDAVAAIGRAVDHARAEASSLADLCEHVGAALDRWPRQSLAGLADPISAHLRQREGAVR